MNLACGEEQQTRRKGKKQERQEPCFNDSPSEFSLLHTKYPQHSVTYDPLSSDRCRWSFAFCNKSAQMGRV